MLPQAKRNLCGTA